MLPYPTSLPLDDVTLLISSFRSGQHDIPRLTKAVWELAGYAALMAAGEPGTVLAEPAIHMGLQSIPDLTTEQVIEYLELFHNHAKQGLPSAVTNLPWRAILKYALTYLLGVL